MPSSYFEEIIVALRVLQLRWGTLAMRLWLKRLIIVGSWAKRPI